MRELFSFQVVFTTFLKTECSDMLTFTYFIFRHYQINSSFLQTIFFYFYYYLLAKKKSTTLKYALKVIFFAGIESYHHEQLNEIQENTTLD